MKQTVLFGLLALSITGSGQIGKDTTVIFYDWNWEKTSAVNAAYYSVSFRKDQVWRRYDFYALNDKLQMEGYYEDEKLEIKTGPFVYYYQNGTPSSSGHYQKNKKIGVWRNWTGEGRLTDSLFYNNEGNLARTCLSWYANGEVSDSIILDDDGNGTSKGYWTSNSTRHFGNMVKGQKSGKWLYYHKNGKVCLEVQYEKDSALNFICYDELGKLQQKNCIYEREAEIKGGSSSWSNHLHQAMSKYLPKEYFNGEMEGIVIVSFVIDVDGKVIEPTIYYSSEPRLNEAALKIISTSPKWIPAIQYNRPVKAYRRQPITFVRAEEE